MILDKIITTEELKKLITHLDEVFDEEQSIRNINIIDYEDKYLLQFKALGYTKEQFQINIVDNMLIVKAEPQKSEDKFIVKNWIINPINLKLNLNYLKNIDKKSFVAKLVCGILEISISKTEVEKINIEIN